MSKKKSRRQIIILGRMFNEGLHNIVRNIWLTTAATAVMTVTLTILLFSATANRALTETIDDRTTDFAVSIYFQASPDQEVLDDLRSHLETQEYVETVTFTSEEQAVQNFVDREDNESIRQSIELSGTPLPSSFDVSLNDLTQVDAVISIAEEELYTSIFDRTGQTDVTKKSAEQYVRIQESVNKLTIAAAGVFGGISVLIIFNTIRMAVFSRSKEIEIMKLIGATPKYIRGPFLVEASLYGIVAALLAFSAVYSIMLSFVPTISSIKSVETIKFFSDYWYAALGVTVFVGVLIGLLSSWLATSKYLKLKRW